MIDASLIPEETMMDLAESTFNFARRAFQNPEIKKAYEKWAEERREKEYGRDKRLSHG